MQENLHQPPAEAPGEKLSSMRKGACQWLRERKVGELVRDRRRLVEVPYTASLRDTMNALVANDVVAVPVVAPPGRWIGAGGTMIVELDRATGAARKHYIGMVTMLDILIHIAAEEEGEELALAISPRAARAGVAAAAAAAAGGASGRVDLEQRMSVPVSSIIGHSLEGLSMWTLNPHTSVLDCMEAFSKGVHRALVPLESQYVENVVAAELVESSPGYRMVTQMDVVSFLRVHNAELDYVMSYTVGELGAVNENVLSITAGTRVMDALNSMRAASLSSVPIVEARGNVTDEHVLLDGKGKKLVNTFSATDLRSCPIDLLQQWLNASVVEFKDKASMHRGAATTVLGADKARSLVTCRRETTLAQVMEAAAVSHVHRVWVVDAQGLLVGIVSLSDMLRAIRESLLVTVTERTS